MKKVISILILTLLLFNCKIEQVYEFNKDGSGEYSFGIDMTEMMKMGATKGSNSASKNIDTLFSFSQMMETYKDSISKLSSKDKARLTALKPLTIKLKVDTSSTNPKMNFKLLYKFNNLKDLKDLSKNIEGQDLQNLISNNKTKKTKKDPKLNKMLSMMDGFEAKINSSKFTYNITKEQLKKSNKKKKRKADANEGKTKPSPFEELIKIKQVFRFPYKIKSIDNKKYKISSDSKSIQLDISVTETENNPKILDVEVKFK